MNQISPLYADVPNASTTVLTDRFNIVGLLEANMVNPNGDPDAANQPRQDPVNETGFISNVCIKRKIRDYVEVVHGVTLYHSNGVVLREQRSEALRAAGIEPSGEEDDAEAQDGGAAEPAPAKGRGKGNAPRKPRAAVTPSDLRRNQQVICGHFWDARTFGAVMDAGAARAANARGPVAVSYGMSVCPVRIIEMAITRQSVESATDNKENRTMGSQSVVRHGLYVFDITVHPFHAARTGFTMADMATLQEALINAFEFDQSSNRRLSLRGLYAFRHASKDGKPSLGHMSRAELLDRVVVTKKDGVEEPTSFGDYVVAVKADDLAAGVSMERWA